MEARLNTLRQAGVDALAVPADMRRVAALYTVEASELGRLLRGPSPVASPSSSTPTRQPGSAESDQPLATAWPSGRGLY